jgi:hypothetical protein
MGWACNNGTMRDHLPWALYNEHEIYGRHGAFWRSRLAKIEMRPYGLSLAFQGVVVLCEYQSVIWRTSGTDQEPGFMV